MKYITISLVVFQMIFFSLGLRAEDDAPDPPEYFYRADERPPLMIFGDARVVGPGFSTWAQARGVTPDESALRHAAGHSCAPAEEGERNSDWVSVAGSVAGVVNGYLGNEVVRRFRFDVRQLPAYWIYQMAPTQHAYDMRWMLRGTVEDSDDPESRRLARLLLHDHGSLDEWIIQHGIPVQQIVRATRYVFSIDADGYVADTRPGSVVENPHYIAPPRPVRQVLNPMLGDTMENASALGYEPDELAPVAASIAALALYASNCAGVGASGINEQGLRTAANSSSAAPPAAHCNYTKHAVKKVTADQLPTTISKLVVRTHTGAEYCLRPANARTPSALATRTYLYLDNCSDSVASQKAVFTLSGQIAFPQDDFGIPMCVTAPENVVGGSSQWDWVQLWPCDRANPYQKWIISKGRLYSQQNPSLYIQDKDFYGVMSKDNSGFDHVLVSGKMPSRFFVDASKEITNWFEIGMNFEQSNVRYYPTAQNNNANINYLNRIYYDDDNKRLVRMEYYGRAFQSFGNSLTCLGSNQVAYGTSSWDWALWENCLAYPSDTKNSLKWSLINDDGSTPITLVHFKDLNGNRLYANLKNSVNWGRLYTSSGFETEGTDNFDTLRRYGFCLSEQGEWHECATPKHSVVENDGELANQDAIQTNLPLLHSVPPSNGRCEHLQWINGKWIWNGARAAYWYTTKQRCERVNRCNQGGACYRWNTRPWDAGQCQHLGWSGTGWQWRNYYAYDNAKACRAANRCQSGGACFRWLAP